MIMFLWVWELDMWSSVKAKLKRQNFNYSVYIQIINRNASQVCMYNAALIYHCKYFAQLYKTTKLLKNSQSELNTYLHVEHS